MSSIAASPELAKPKRDTAPIFALFGAIAVQWTRAQEARRLSEKYLVLGEEALTARGTNREAVINRIRRVMTDKV